METQLTDRWSPLLYHLEQQRLWCSSARFRLASAGRRSGKTELAKRFLVKCALAEREMENARFIFAAPTYAQAKEIYWEDAKALVPSWAKIKTREAQLTIRLINNARIMVAGLDRPQRIEGSKLRGIVVDEIANCPLKAWPENIRPALSDPECLGWAWLIGVPEGRNFFYRLTKDAEACTTGEWDHFTWLSADILPPAEITAAKAELDLLTYQQEYEGSFVTFEGRAYYGFGKDNLRALEYDPKLELIFCFDFNYKPGVAAVIQEQPIGTCVIGEVWIPQNSNTIAVCARLAKDWSEKHKGRVSCYGDATGGAHRSAQIAGTDWELVEQSLRRAFPGTVEVGGEDFSQVILDIAGSNPPERVRLNAMNSRILTADGTRKFFVDPQKAPHVAEDFDGVRLLVGGSGEINKKSDPMLTHLSDAIGYYVERKFPLGGEDDVTYEQLY